MNCQALVKAFYEGNKTRPCKMHGLHQVTIDGQKVSICQNHFYQLKRARIGDRNATIPLYKLN